ncbi:MAG TPA: hypothetical protein VMT88_11360, partial [Actinomycetes bacterium]|nr:hypothetical protein [Actinomycetes bacterium]
FSNEHGIEERPLVQALEENLEGSRAWDPQKWSVSPFAYLERGRYIDYLEPWFERFTPTMHIRFLDDNVREGLEIATLYRALGVDAEFRPDDEGRRVNESAGSVPELDGALVARLRGYFHDSDRRLAARLGREVPWATS